MKAIVIIRTSTDRQEVESQKKEVIELAIQDGFSEDNIIVIGDKGTSAIKEDTRFKENLKQLKTLIATDPEITTVYAWAIDRLGRREVTLFELKEYLIKNKVNLVIKNPSLRLFNPDGSVNGGVELAFSLFATMSRQEMEMKKERFQRAKRRMKEEGKFSGGLVRYGYTVDGEGYIILHEEQAKLIKEIFNLYSCGKYSFQSLAEELNMRGYKYKTRAFDFNIVGKILAREKYIEIVGEDTWNLCKDIREGRIQDTRKTRESKHIRIASGLIVCPECGHKFTADGQRYACTHNNKKYTCRIGIGINIEVMDNILVESILPIHEKYISSLDQESIKEYTEKIAILEKKIITLREKTYDLPMKKKRVQEGYENGIYTAKEYQEKVGRLMKEGIDLTAKINLFEDEKESYQEAIEDLKNGTGVTEIIDYGMKEDKIARIREIVHKHTRVIHIYKVTEEEQKVYGKAIKIEIDLKNGEKIWYVYNGKKRKYQKLAISEGEVEK